MSYDRRSVPALSFSLDRNDSVLCYMLNMCEEDLSNPARYKIQRHIIAPENFHVATTREIERRRDIDVNKDLKVCSH